MLCHIVNYTPIDYDYYFVFCFFVCCGWSEPVIPRSIFQFDNIVNQYAFNQISSDHSIIHSICICIFERENELKSLWDMIRWEVCKLIDGETLQWSSFIESLASHYRKTNGVWSFGLWFVCFDSIPTANRRLNWSLSFSESLHIYPFFEFLYLTPWMSWQCYPSHVLPIFAFAFVFTVFVPISPLIGNPIIYYSALSIEKSIPKPLHQCC